MSRAAYTVIIATHRRPVLLQRALQSVLSQKEPFHQIIVVSDVCDSETYHLSNSLLRAGDIFVQRSGTPGPAASRNTALKLVTGSHVVFLDDDDAFREDFLSDVMRLQRDCHDPEILFTNFEVIQEHENGRVLPNDLSILKPEFLWIRNFIPNNCLIYPYSRLTGVWYDERIAYEDWDFLLSAYTHTPLRHVPIYGPLIYKNADAPEVNRREKDFSNAAECYALTYKKHPATPEIQMQRRIFLQSEGIDIGPWS